MQSSDPAVPRAELPVTVAVLTYRRNRELAELVPILRAELCVAPAGSCLLVVDNDPAGGARELITSGDATVRYVCEPAPGIAAARNRALDETATDLLAFLDDDEVPCAGWLQLLLAERVRVGAAAVAGPVVSRFAEPISGFVQAGRFFERRRMPTGTALTVAATNNLLLDLRAVRRLGLRFDERFGLSGGSDYLFTSRLHRAGERLFWCDEAVVFDMVPARRCTARWVLRRAFRTGNGTAVIEVALARPGLPRLGTRLRYAAAGLVRIAGGAGEIALGTATRSLTGRATGARHLARGAGLLSGAAGLLHAEYGRGRSSRPADGDAKGAARARAAA